MKPTVRPAVQDSYWYLAAERQKIFHCRLLGKPEPWTDDPILKRYKFCNSYRASDRVSQYLIRHVIYGRQAIDLPVEDVFFRVILFRLFSRESTWITLEAETGGVGRKTLGVSRGGDILDLLRRRRPIYTAAFILSAHNSYNQDSKHRNHLALVHDMLRPGRLGKRLAKASSLQDVYEALVSWPMIGPFLGYQLAIDLNYTEHLNFSENDFTMPGPGAVRGLKKVFRDPGDQTPHQLIRRMVDRQEEEFNRLKIDWQNLFGRPLHAIDCQGLFCETDKYARQAFPELKSDRVRIKQEFRPDSEPLRFFYPPKWALNEKVIKAEQQRVPPTYFAQTFDLPGSA
jgi:5-hmdU DNA kinase-like protein